MARSVSNKDFIEKIKTIGINTGAASFEQQLGRAKRGGEPKCPDCGEPMAEVVGLIVKMPKKGNQK